MGERGIADGDEGTARPGRGAAGAPRARALPPAGWAVLNGAVSTSEECSKPPGVVLTHKTQVKITPTKKKATPPNFSFDFRMAF